MDGESVEQKEDELENVTSSGEWFMQGWRNETGVDSRDAQRNERLVIFREDVGGQESVTTDEERVPMQSW